MNFGECLIEQHCQLLFAWYRSFRIERLITIIYSFKINFLIKFIHMSLLFTFRYRPFLFENHHSFLHFVKLTQLKKGFVKFCVLNPINVKLMSNYFWGQIRYFLSHNIKRICINALLKKTIKICPLQSAGFSIDVPGRAQSCQFNTLTFLYRIWIY